MTEPSRGSVGGVSCCELIAAATSSRPQQLLCKRKRGREGGRREGSDANNRRFTEDRALGEMMYRMSSASAP